MGRPIGSKYKPRKVRPGPRQTKRIGEEILELIRTCQQGRINVHEIAAGVMEVGVERINGDALFDAIRDRFSLFKCVFCMQWLSTRHEFRTGEEVCNHCNGKRQAEREQTTQSPASPKL